VSGDPLFRLKSYIHQRFKVIEPEGGAIAPCAGLILEGSGEGRCVKRTFFADVLPDRRFNVAASKYVCGFLVGSHLVSSFVEMKLALSRKEESQCTFQGGNRGKDRRRRAGEDEAAGVTVQLARAVRHVGVSRSVTASTGYDKKHLNLGIKPEFQVG